MNSAKTISRRDLFTGFIQRAKNIAHPPEPEIPETKSIEPRVAIVQGRFCLAYQKSFCSTCIERCPIEGAIILRDNLPMVKANLCDGCGICHQVCPAPRNAILMLERELSSTRSARDDTSRCGLRTIRAPGPCSNAPETSIR